MVKSNMLLCIVTMLLVVYVLLIARKQSAKIWSTFKEGDDLELTICDTHPKREESKCLERKNIAFVKTHKTGSTTVMNILQRFGFRRNLTFVFPRKGLVYLAPHKTTLKPWFIRPPPANKTFNILCNHVVYNKQDFRRVMPGDTVYISIVRHPFQRFRSAFWYYSFSNPQDYLVNIKGDNKLREFLKDPDAHERGSEYTNNGMAFDLGLSPVHFHNRFETLEHIWKIDWDFTLVLVLEYFDESLVLLKRKLCWSLADILYIPKNKRSHLNKRKSFPEYTVTRLEQKRHRAWDEADFLFYEHFHDKLMRYVDMEGGIFVEEVRHFKDILRKVSRFCKAGNDVNANKASCLHLAESSFNKPFSVSWAQCELLLIEKEEMFTRKLIQRQYGDNIL